MGGFKLPGWGEENETCMYVLHSVANRHDRCKNFPLRAQHTIA